MTGKEDLSGRRWVSRSVLATVLCSVLAFGGVYAWAWIPLILAMIGVTVLGFVPGRRSSRAVNIVGIGWALSLVAICVQLIPLPPLALRRVSPALMPLLQEYLLSAGDVGGRHSLSLEPALTIRSLIFGTALLFWLYGLHRLMTTAIAISIARGLIWIGVALALFGIIQRAFPEAGIYGFWIPDGGLGNVFGPFVNRNHFAGWMIMAIGVGLGYLAAEIYRWQPTPRTGWRQILLKMAEPQGSKLFLSVFGLLTMTIATVWALSRSGIISLLVVILAFVKSTRLVRASKTAVALGVALLIAGVLWRGPEVIATKFADTESFENRISAWQDTLRIASDFRWVGTGMNTYGVAMLFYQTGNPYTHMAEAHNDYLQLLSDGGLLVSIPVMATVMVAATFIYKAISDKSRSSRLRAVQAGAAAGLLGIAIQELAEFSLQKPANALLATTLLAIALYEPTKGSQLSARDTPRPDIQTR